MSVQKRTEDILHSRTPEVLRTLLERNEEQRQQQQHPESSTQTNHNVNSSGQHMQVVTVNRTAGVSSEPMNVEDRPSSAPAAGTIVHVSQPQMISVSEHAPAPSQTNEQISMSQAMNITQNQSVMVSQGHVHQQVSQNHHMQLTNMQPMQAQQVVVGVTVPMSEAQAPSQEPQNLTTLTNYHAHDSANHWLVPGQAPTQVEYILPHEGSYTTAEGLQGLQQAAEFSHTGEVRWQGHIVPIIEMASAEDSRQTVPETKPGLKDNVSSVPVVKRSAKVKDKVMKPRKKKRKLADLLAEGIDPTRLEENCEQVRQRFVKGCECMEENCFKGLNPEFVYRHRLNIAELTKAEHDMYLMGVTMASLSNPEETVRHKERKRLRAQYVFQGKKVCLDAFLYVENCTHYQLKRIRKHVMTHGVQPRVHGNHGKKPHNTFSLDIYQHATQFLHSYIQRYAPQAQQVPKSKWKNKTPPVFLPPDITRKKIHAAYKEYCETFEPLIKVMGYSTFRHFMKEQFPHLRFFKLENKPSGQSVSEMKMETEKSTGDTQTQEEVTASSSMPPQQGVQSINDQKSNASSQALATCVPQHTTILTTSTHQEHMQHNPQTLSQPPQPHQVTPSALHQVATLPVMVPAPTSTPQSQITYSNQVPQHATLSTLVVTPVTLQPGESFTHHQNIPQYSTQVPVSQNTDVPSTTTVSQTAYAFTSL